MDHFEFKVGPITVRVHQAFMSAEIPTISIVGSGEVICLTVVKSDSGAIEIKRDDWAAVAR